MKLRTIAHSRAGDKGDISNISVIARDPADYERLLKLVTADRVQAHFSGMMQGVVERYELPRLGALNFVLHGILGGGVTRSLRLDSHGKCLSSHMLDLDIEPHAQAKKREAMTEQ